MAGLWRSRARRVQRIRSGVSGTWGAATLGRTSRTGGHAVSEPRQDLAPAPGDSPVDGAGVADLDPARKQVAALEPPPRCRMQPAKLPAFWLKDQIGLGRHGGTLRRLPPV